jgi:CHAD domain-containing protein
MRATRRHDWKLGRPVGIRPPTLGGPLLEPPVVTSVYHDVPGGALAAAGITLLCRTGQGRSIWQLTLPADGSPLELEEEGAPLEPPRALLALLRAHLRHGPLEPVAELRSTRRSEGLDGGVRKDPPAGSPFEELRTRLRHQLHEIERHDPGTRLGRDPESLHDMRVAVRRLRALLRAGRKLVATDTTELDARLKQLGRVLGEVRDLDVLLARLEGEASELDGGDAEQARSLLAALRTERSSSRARLLGALRSDEYLSLLDDTARTIDDLEPGEAEVSLDDLADRAFAKLYKAVDKLPDEPADHELHAVRKTGKRARYAAELADWKKPVRRAKKFQDVLGEHQDAVVAAERLRKLAAGAPPEKALAAGRLVEREEEHRMESRAAWPKAWKKLRKTI